MSGRKERKLWSWPALACFMTKATSVYMAFRVRRSRRGQNSLRALLRVKLLRKLVRSSWSKSSSLVVTFGAWQTRKHTYFLCVGESSSVWASLLVGEFTGYHLIASFDFMLGVALISRRRRRKTLMNSNENIAYSWRSDWKPKAYASFAPYLKVFKDDLWHVRVSVWKVKKVIW